MTKRIYIFNEETQSINIEKVIDIFADEIETKQGLYPLENAVKYYDETNNAISYFYNVDLPAKLETENLKKLRRSQAINNMFSFENQKPLDLMQYIPYLIIIILILFR